MRFKWYGTATIMIKSGDSRLLVDPYTKKYSDDPLSPSDEMLSADAVLVTHPHVDHFVDTDAFAAGSPVYVSGKGIRLAEKNGLRTNDMHEIRAGDAFTVGSLCVRVFPARHCRFDAATVLRVLFSPRTYRRLPDCIRLLSEASRFRIKRGETLAFSVSDGEKTALVFGSAGMTDGAAYPQGADLLVFPYQGRRRMDKELIPFLERLRPKCVAIDHFDDAFPPVSDSVNTNRFASTVGKYLPTASALIPQPGVWYEI